MLVQWTWNLVENADQFYLILETYTVNRKHQTTITGIKVMSMNLLHSSTLAQSYTHHMTMDLQRNAFWNTLDTGYEHSNVTTNTVYNWYKWLMCICSNTAQRNIVDSVSGLRNNFIQKNIKTYIQTWDLLSKLTGSWDTVNYVRCKMNLINVSK
jgi:hypothetical protein